jgi:hypothetical protein
MMQAIGVQKTSGTGITIRSECDLKVLTWTNTADWPTSWISSPTRKRWWPTFGDKPPNDTPGFAVSTPASSTLVVSSVSRSPSASKSPRYRRSWCICGKMVLLGAASRQELQQAAPSSADDLRDP